MNILVLADGGKDSGFGHASRCAALVQALRGLMSKETPAVKFIVKGDKTVKRILKESIFSPEIKDWVKNYKRMAPEIKKSDLVIVDSYKADKKVYDFIYCNISTAAVGQPPYRLVCLDDYNRLAYPPSVLINPSVYGEKLDYRANGGIRLLGKDYIILRREFWKVPEKRIGKKIRNVMVTFGGSRHKDITIKLLNALSKKLPDAKYHVVDQSFGGSRGNLRVYSGLSAAEMARLMLKCDLCISAGGVTLYELARCGVPTIGICFAGNQRYNLEYLSKSGSIEFAGRHNDAALLRRLEACVDNLVPYGARRRRSKSLRSIVDGKGARRIADIVTRTNGFELRTATKADTYDLWKWRNHLAVRRWCYQPDKIKFEAHKKWFTRKMADKNVRIYIAENTAGQKIGQVRLEADGNGSALVNVNLNPDFLGKGFGSHIIKKASESFFRNKSGVKEIVAEIVDENIASRRVFQKAGYSFFSGGFKDGKNIGIFKLERTNI